MGSECNGFIIHFLYCFNASHVLDGLLAIQFYVVIFCLLQLLAPNPTPPNPTTQNSRTLLAFSFVQLDDIFSVACRENIGIVRKLIQYWNMIAAIEFLFCCIIPAAVFFPPSSRGHIIRVVLCFCLVVIVFLCAHQCK